MPLDTLGIRPVKALSKPKLEPTAIRRKRELAYIKQNPILFTVAIIAFITSIFFLFADSDDAASLAQVLKQPWQTVWLVAYGTSGLMIMYGFLKFDSRYEASGLVLLCACCLANLYAVISFRGFGALLGTSMILALGIGSGFRAWVILTFKS